MPQNLVWFSGENETLGSPEEDILPPITHTSPKWSREISENNTDVGSGDVGMTHIETTTTRTFLTREQTSLPTDLPITNQSQDLSTRSSVNSTDYRPPGSPEHIDNRTVTREHQRVESVTAQLNLSQTDDGNYQKEEIKERKKFHNYKLIHQKVSIKFSRHKSLCVHIKNNFLSIIVKIWVIHMFFSFLSSCQNFKLRFG